MNQNPFTSVNKFFNETSKSINDELDTLDNLSFQGVDIAAMLEEAGNKVAALRKQAEELIEYTYNQEVENINKTV